MLSRSRLAAIARSKYIEYYGLPVCRRCGNEKADVHHANGDKTDNRKVNLRAYCRSCHITIHNRREPRRQKEYYRFHKDGRRWIIHRGRKRVDRDDSGNLILFKRQAVAYARVLLERDRSIS